VEFDDRRTDGDGGFDLRRIGSDEERDFDAGCLQGLGRLADAGELASDVESAFGRDLFARFGDEADGGGTKLEGEGGHRRRTCHLEIETDAWDRGDGMDVSVLDMAAIFTQVERDTVGTADEGFAGEGQDVRLGVRGLVRTAVTRLTERCGVVDVDAKEERTGGHQASV
jgi:hypothetical protein